VESLLVVEVVAVVGLIVVEVVVDAIPF